MDLSIIIPAHNEAATIGGPLFAKSANWISTEYPSSELIIVDDGSTDDTADKASLVADKVLRQEHSGKGAALCRGMHEATGDIVLWTDADWSVPVTETRKLIRRILTGADYVMGSRGWARPGSPLSRQLGSSLYTLACRMTFDWEFKDTQCGIKALNRKTSATLLHQLRFFGPGIKQDFPSTDALFDVECLLIARQAGLRVTTVPVRWQHVRNRSATSYLPLLKRIGRDFTKVSRAYQNGAYSSNVAG